MAKAAWSDAYRASLLSYSIKKGGTPNRRPLEPEGGDELLTADEFNALVPTLDGVRSAANAPGMGARVAEVAGRGGRAGRACRG